MPSLIEVPPGVLVLGGIAAAHVAAGKAQPQFHPGVASLDAIFALALVGAVDLDLVEMVALAGHKIPFRLARLLQIRFRRAPAHPAEWLTTLARFLARNFCALLARLGKPNGNSLLAALDLVLARFHLAHFGAHLAAGFAAVAPRPSVSWHYVLLINVT